MLFGGHLGFGRSLALHDLRQAGVVVVRDRIIAALFVDRDKPFKQNHLASGAQGHLPICAAHIHRRAFQKGCGHLAGDGAFIDQVVDLALIRISDFQRLGAAHHIGRADAFMRFLRVFRLVFIHPGAVGQVFFAKLGPDRIAGGHHRLGRHVDAVGAHIGDQARLIQALRRRHRHFRAHAVFTARLLLQCRGHERRGGVAGGGFRLDRQDRQVAGPDRLHRHFGGGFVGQVKFIQLFAGK